MALDFPTDPSEIPVQPRADVIANIRRMVRYAELGLSQDLGEGDLMVFSTRTLEYVRSQLQRLERMLDEDTDLLAWIARGLFEMLLLTRYALQSTSNLQEVIVRQVGEYQELQRGWFNEEAAPADIPEAVEFDDSVNAMRAWADQNRLSIKSRYVQSALAKDTSSLQEFYKMYKPLSKFAHPTPLFLFGKHEFVHGENTRHGFVRAAQLSAVWILQELPSLVEQLKNPNTQL